MTVDNVVTETICANQSEGRNMVDSVNNMTVGDDVDDVV
jgi:hypothetical protein